MLEVWKEELTDGRGRHRWRTGLDGVHPGNTWDPEWQIWVGPRLTTPEPTMGRIRPAGELCGSKSEPLRISVCLLLNLLLEMMCAEP